MPKFYFFYFSFFQNQSYLYTFEKSKIKSQYEISRIRLYTAQFEIHQQAI